MEKSRNTKSALFSSIVALLLCLSMLVGTTFAWFTDSVASGRNTIQAGNLDVVLEYWDGDSYEEVTAETKLFNDEALWEPGYTEVAYLKVSNAGSLALKYRFAATVYDETLGKTKDGEDIALSEYLQFKVVEGDADLAGTYTRDTAQNADAAATKLQSYSSEVKSLEARNEDGTNDYADYVALIIYMPASVGNEANHDGENIPKIKLGTNLYATQDTVEADSFDDQYDVDAEFPWDGVSTKAPVQDADGYYTIGSPAELAWLAAGDRKLKNVKLTADIDMLGVTIDPIGLNSYYTFEGNGKTISNVVVSGTGLFSNNSAQGTIQNLVLDNVTVNSEGSEAAWVGIVAGKMSGSYKNITVMNSTVNAPLAEFVGGIAGAYYTYTLYGCKVENCTVIGYEKVGGLVGMYSVSEIYAAGRLQDCSVSNVTVVANNSAKAYAGVLLGRGLATAQYAITFESCSAAMKADQKLIGHDYYSNIDVSTVTVTTID